jgi:hypothetical protein
VLHRKALFHQRDQMEHGANAERPGGDAEEAFAPAHDRKNGLDQADKIEADGDAQPKNTGFSHVV